MSAHRVRSNRGPFSLLVIAALGVLAVVCQAVFPFWHLVTTECHEHEAATRHHTVCEEFCTTGAASESHAASHRWAARFAHEPQESCAHAPVVRGHHGAKDRHFHHQCILCTSARGAVVFDFRVRSTTPFTVRQHGSRAPIDADSNKSLRRRLYFRGAIPRAPPALS